MKSIETIKNAIRVLDENIILADDEYKPYITCEREEYKQVLKDLEVLEILKPKIKNCINFLNFCNKEEKEKIKEWLEGE